MKMKYIKLNNIVKEAYDNVPIYINFSDNTERVTGINNAPIITKQIFVEKQDACLTPSYYMDYLQNRLIKARTSGSTGHYLQIVWSVSDYHQSMMELWLKRIKYYNIRPDNKLAYFFTDNRFNNSNMYVRKKQELGISKAGLLPDLIDEAYRYIVEWNPEWMLLQPSTAVILAEYIKRNHAKLPDQLRYIEFSGEVLTDDVRQITEKVFNCKTADQYGANEVNSIAYECPCGSKHIMTSNVYVEIVDDEGNILSDSVTPGECVKSGRIILTSLTNKAMPFIRYDIGDVGRIVWKKCMCGNRQPVLELEGGRCNDYIYINDTERINPYIFVSIFDKVNVVLEGAILQFSIVQNNYDEFTITLYTDGDFSNDEISEVFMECIDNNYLRQANYNLIYTENPINNGNNGKYAYFRNKIQLIE